MHLPHAFFCIRHRFRRIRLSSVEHTKLHQLYLCGGLLRYLKFPTTNADRFVELGEVLELMQDKSAYRQVLIALRQVEVEQFIGLCNLQTP